MTIHSYLASERLRFLAWAIHLLADGLTAPFTTP